MRGIGFFSIVPFKSAPNLGAIVSKLFFEQALITENLVDQVEGPLAGLAQCVVFGVAKVISIAIQSRF